MEGLIKKGTSFPWIIVLLFSAAVMRFWNLCSLSFSNDELSAIIRTRYTGISELISHGVYIDFHPAGVQLFLYYWIGLFGESVFWVRLPFVLFGLASIWLIYRIGKTWFNEFTGLAAAACFAFLPLTIQYNQFARMYSPGVFFSLLACYGWMNYLFFSGEKKYGWIWFLGMTACLHIHYFAFAYAGLLGATGIFFLKRTNWKFYLSAGVVSLMTFLLEWRIFAEQMKTGDIGGWLPAPKSDWIFQYFWDIWNHSLVLVILMTVLFVYGIFIPVSKKSRWRIVCLSWFSLSFTIAYLYSVLGHPVIQNSTLLFTWPFFLLAMFSFLPEKFVEGKKGLLLLAVLSVFMVGNTIASGFYTTPRFGVFKELAEDIRRFRKEKGEKLPFVINVINPDYFRFYQIEPDEDKYNLYKVEQSSDLSSLISRVKDSSSDYFGYAWSNSLHPEEIVSIISERYPYLVYKRSSFNAAVYLFSRNPEGSMLHYVYSDTCDFERKNWGSVNVTSDRYYSPPNSFRFTTDFSPGLQKKMEEIPSGNYLVLNFAVRYLPISKLTEAQIVVSIDRGEKNILYKNILLSEFSSGASHFSQALLSFPLPDDLLPNDILKAYLFNPQHDSLYIDDLIFSVREDDNPYADVY